MDSVCLIRHTLRDSMENCDNQRSCSPMEKDVVYDKNSKTIKIFLLFFFASSKFITSHPGDRNSSVL